MDQLIKTKTRVNTAKVAKVVAISVSVAAVSVALGFMVGSFAIGSLSSVGSKAVKSLTGANRGSLADMVNKGLDSGIGATTTMAFRRGDSNVDGVVDISDLNPIYEYLYLRKPVSCLDAIDVNDDGIIDQSDPIYWTNWFNFGRSEPPAPGPFTIGLDPTYDTLGCEFYPGGVTTTTPDMPRPTTTVVTVGFLPMARLPEPFSPTSTASTTIDRFQIVNHEESEQAVRLSRIGFQYEIATTSDSHTSAPTTTATLLGVSLIFNGETITSRSMRVYTNRINYFEFRPFIIEAPRSQVGTTTSPIFSIVGEINPEGSDYRGRLFFAPGSEGVTLHGMDWEAVEPEYTQRYGTWFEVGR